jgi:D-alanine-D-alanine ligase
MDDAMTSSDSDHPSSLCVALLAGGDSDEAVISRRSGVAVQQALTSRGHIVVPLDPAYVDLASLDWRTFDVAFIALHGRFGEDGQVQELLEQVGMPYTGSRAAASRLCFSKSATKERLLQYGLPTPDYVLVHSSDPRERLLQMVQELGSPLVIKPDAQGSSLGVTITPDTGRWEAAFETCFQYDSFGLIERYIPGTEWTVGLLDELILPPIQIETPHHFYDYTAKYSADDTRYVFDDDPNSAVREAVEEVAIATCRALGTSGLVRVDLRVDADGQPWVLEVNTIPGLTDHSLVPKAAAHLGIEFAELCERSIRAVLRSNVPRPHIWQNTPVRRRPV